MNSVIGTNLGEFTIGWFLLSVVLGGILGTVLKYLFDVRLAENFKRIQSEKQKIKKYSYPLLQAANDVELRIENILTKGVQNNWLDSKIVNDIKNNKGFLEDPYDGVGYFYLSTIYLFARYFAWLEILKREIGYLETSIKDKKSKVFFEIIHKITNSFRYVGLWDFKNVTDCVKLYRHIQSAIGEIMIKKDSQDIECITFQEFIQKYKSKESDVFRFWLASLSKYFENLVELTDDKFENLDNLKDYRIYRLIAIQFWVYRLINFLDPKFKKVQRRPTRYIETILNRLPPQYRKKVTEIPFN